LPRLARARTPPATNDAFITAYCTMAAAQQAPPSRTAARLGAGAAGIMRFVTVSFSSFRRRAVLAGQHQPGPRAAGHHQPDDAAGIPAAPRALWRA
jgi:hypothetical protein